MDEETTGRYLVGYLTAMHLVIFGLLFAYGNEIRRGVDLDLAKIGKCKNLHKEILGRAYNIKCLDE